MKRVVLILVALGLFARGSLIAHHSYGEYDRDKPVALEGKVKRVSWVNPHVLLVLETQKQGEYMIEWGAISQLARQGLDALSIKEGDHLVITGSVNRNPEKKVLTLLREINRPADGWHWGRS